MSVFEIAIETVLKNEGGFSDDPVDPGGATNRGLTLRFIRSLGGHGGMAARYTTFTVEDLKNLSEDETKSIYRWAWWDFWGFGRINDQTLATKVFDLAVNMGTHQAILLLQRACWAINGYQYINDDGLLGKQTLDAANAINPIQPLRSEAAGFYRKLMTTNPALSKFRQDWLRRAYQ